MKKIPLVCLILLIGSLVFTSCGEEPAQTTDKTDATTTTPIITDTPESTKTPVTTQAPTSTKATNTIQAPGLYDDNDNLLASWDELVNTYGLQADVNYLPLANEHTAVDTSFYNVLRNASALQSGTKLVIGNITHIGYHAFSDCTNLTSVTIPDSVTSFGSYVFSGCTNLTSILVSKKNSQFSSDGIALYNKYKTKLIQVPTGVSSFTIPNSVTSIDSYAFDSCTNLTSVTIPAGVTSVDYTAFSDCTSLASILVNDSNTKYSSDGIALYNKDKTELIQAPKGVDSFAVPNGVTSIGDWAFYKCKNLKSVTIPTSVTSIGSCAFDACRSLESVTIPDSVTSIGSLPFSDCSNLTSIFVNPNNQNYSSDGVALYNKDKTKLIQVPNGVTSFTIPNSVTSITYYAFEACIYLTSITIPDSVISIGKSAFYGCTNLKSVVIGNNVASIGDLPFLLCTNLESILVNPNNQNYSSDGVALYNKHKTKLIQVPEKVASFVIPESVLSIENSAFVACKNLTSITIPESVTSIECSAFVGCTGLTSITIPNSVTFINHDAFYDCTSLTDITFTGSKAQWNEVFKEINWNYHVPATEVVCTDGTVTLK